MTPGAPSQSHEIDTSPDCPGENELVDLVEGRLAGPRGADVRTHVLGCSTCQDLVGDLSGDDAPARLARGDEVGRYLVLGVLGSGAMGVVYEAFDPELARKVALKLVRAEGHSTRRDELAVRLLREAQSMARVAHPNVIAVHDVGRLGDQVFLAMELVLGGTLATWLAARPRTTDEIVGAFVQAGRGLAAAHAAGLVHRDFKPDNVLVGDDGRVRVTDFGLARTDEHAEGGAVPGDSPLGTATLTRTGAVLGTPAYMAPEQLAGKRSDARADVYAFSVALYEALAGVRPFSAGSVGELREAIAKGALREPKRKLPTAVRAAIVRGLAPRLDDRWPDMTSMIAALEPRPRTKLAVGLSAAALVTIAAAVALASTRAAPVCRGAEQAWAGVWGDEARTTVRAAFVKSGGAAAERALDAVDVALASRRAEWLAMHTEACEATRVRGEQSEALLDRRMSCLDDRRRETAALVHLLAEADASLVERAASSVKRLSPLDDCRNARALGTSAASPAAEREREHAVGGAIAEARALRAAGHYARGLEVAERGASLAAPLSDGRLRGSALFAKAILLEEQMRYPEAEATYQAAVRAALSAHDDASSADAWMQLGGIAGYRREQAGEAYVFLGYADAAIENLGGDRARRAKMYERRSLIEWAVEARLEDAAADYARSLALEKGLPIEESARFLESHGPVQFDMGRFDVAERVYVENVARIKREKGPEHPELLEEEGNVAETRAILGRPQETVITFRDLIRRYPDRARGWANHRLAEALRRTGDPRAALVEDDLAIAAEEGPEGSITRASGHHGRGVDLWMLGRHRDAITELERAATMRRPAKLATIRAETDFALARALWDGGGDKARARALAQSAREAYAAAAERYGSRWYAAYAADIATWEHAR